MGGEDMRPPAPAQPRRRATDARCQVPSRLQCSREISIPAMHLADQDGPTQPQRLEHAVHDLDLVTFGVDLHHIGLEFPS
jgi:hypothetical protein